MNRRALELGYNKLVTSVYRLCEVRNENYVKIGIMSYRRSTTVRNILPFALLMGIPGWVGVIYLMTQTKPTLSHRWFFFCAVVFAITGTSAPWVALLNRLFTHRMPVGFGMVVREALWIGIYIATLIWLNKGQVLTLSLAAVLAVGFVLVEILLRLRARSEWHPGKYPDE